MQKDCDCVKIIVVKELRYPDVTLDSLSWRAYTEKLVVQLRVVFFNFVPFNKIFACGCTPKDLLVDFFGPNCPTSLSFMMEQLQIP